MVNRRGFFGRLLGLAGAAAAPEAAKAVEEPKKPTVVESTTATTSTFRMAFYVVNGMEPAAGKPQLVELDWKIPTITIPADYKPSK